MWNPNAEHSLTNMELNLEKPILFFDIESTGLNIASDSIIELSFVKVLPGNEVRVRTWRVRPWDYLTNSQKKINPSAQEVHKISDEDLVNEKKFYEIVDEVQEWLDGCDLAGFNSNKFDLPMLAEELERVRKFKNRNIRIDLHQMKMVDVQNIYHQLEPRNLKAAYKFYCGKSLENAHAAEADTMATYEVLKAQLDKYPEQLKNDVNFLANFSERQKIVDYAGRLVYNDKKEVVINFGKHRGKTAREVYETEPSYFSWVENGEFTLDTKQQFILLRRQFESEKQEARKAAMKKLTDKELEKSVGSLAEKWGTGKLF